MSHPIRRVAVLGAGVMGSGIAAHLANAGIESVLFDIVPRDAGESPAARNAYALNGIKTATKLKPAPLHRPELAALITPANYEDHGELLSTCDWVVEVVVERLDIKEKVFSWVAEHIAPHAILSSNTSGIRLADMTASMSDDLRRRFLITHFFNPVRYMRLLELVTGPHTDPAITAQIARFGAEVLGKGIVYGKDTPNFVANRIGCYGIASVFRMMSETGLSIEQIDAIFGAPMGRPKSAIFRTADVVGIDTLVHVFQNVYDSATEDEEREAFRMPSFVTDLVADGRAGQKSGAGFYKKAKVDGQKVIQVLDPETLTYRTAEKVRFPCIGAARKLETAAGKLHAMVWGDADDPASAAAWRCTAETLVYSANRIPEIADDVVNIDRGMKWGFGWELGPFESWDAIGVRKSVERMKSDGMAVPAWIDAMLEAGRETFYVRDGATMTYWAAGGGVEAVPTSDKHLFIADLKATTDVVNRNVSASLHDMGDGALLLEFHSKMNAIDDGIVAMYSDALDRLDAGEFSALVVGNEAGKAFCAGANLLMILMGANQKDWTQIEGMLDGLQQLLMRAKYSTSPVVTAPHYLALGGGCEIAMQSTATVAGGELYMGLVEVGVGLIPGAGGCKELVARYTGDIPADIDADMNPFIQKAFERIGLAKVTSSAGEARAWGYLRPHDRIVLDHDARLSTAKTLALGLAASGHVPPKPRVMKAAGENCKVAIEGYLYTMALGGYATEHDVTVGSKLAHVLTGGDVPTGTLRTEQDYLDLEREVFLSLCGEEKTLARIQHMLMNNKPLRN